MTSEVKLYLYSTLGCHLCDDALAIVAPYKESLCFSLIVKDIAQDDKLFARYGTTIPVLAYGNSLHIGELFWPFDAEDFEHWFEPYR